MRQARKTTLDKVLESQTRLKKMTFEEFEGEWRAEAHWEGDWVNLVAGLIHMAFVEGKGVNYVSFRACLTLVSAQEYEVVIRRCPSGKTPAEANMELRAELARATARIAELEAKV